MRRRRVWSALAPMRIAWSAWLVEPLMALLTIAASYGTSALIKTLGGGTELSSLSQDLVKALAESESRIDERLTAIELKLDELLEQRYKVAVHTGMRYLLDAIPAGALPRAHDLDRARNAFIEAQAAARSSLQQALAERYLLLCSLGLQRTELVMPILTRLEGLAMTAAFEAMYLTENNREQAAALMRREGFSLPRLVTPDRRRRAELQVKSAALDTIGISSRLLGEAAVFGPLVGLPPRVTPPLEGIIDPTLVEGIYLGIGGRLVIPPRPSVPDKGYWTFTIRPGETLRIGSLTVQIRPGPAQPEDDVMTRHQGPSPHDFGPSSARQHIRLDLAWPPPLPLRVEVSTAGPHAPNQPGFAGLERPDYSARAVASKTSPRAAADPAAATEAEVSIPQPRPGSSVPVLTISPNTFRSLIEVTCMT